MANYGRHICARRTMLTHRNSGTINVTIEDVAQMMSLPKKVRHIFGDQTNLENFVDDAGFTSIAGMLAG